MTLPLLKTFSKCISTGKALQADCASMITKNDKYVSRAAPSSVSRGVINNSHLLIKLTWHLVSLLIRTIHPHCGCRCGEALKSHWPSPLWLQVGRVLRTVWMMSASSAPTAQSSLQASSCSRSCRVVGHLDTDLVISLDLVTTTLAMTLGTRVDLFRGLAYALFGEDV